MHGGHQYHRVYPRVCGGTVSRACRASARAGLSPRVRGNHFDARPRWPALRSIPACAGEPRAGQRGRATQRVYPRVCGGTFIIPVGAAGVKGLSPRVRGNPEHAGRVQVQVRSIPACAGEPLDGAVFRLNAEVYPRVCGGTCVLRYQRARGPGLSPRVRGNRSNPPAVAFSHRSIPACAGEP